jgi:hypothetical protein
MILFFLKVRKEKEVEAFESTNNMNMQSVREEEI